MNGDNKTSTTQVDSEYSGPLPRAKHQITAHEGKAILGNEAVSRLLLSDEAASKQAISPSFKISSAAAEKLSALQAYANIRTAIPLLTADCISVSASMEIANFVVWLFGQSVPFQGSAYPFLILWAVLIQHIHGMYPAVGLSNTIEFRRSLRTCLVVTTGVFLTQLFRSNEGWESWVAAWIFLCVLPVLLPNLRALTRRLLKNQVWWTQNVLVVGDDTPAKELMNHLAKRNQEGIRPIGIAFDPRHLWNSTRSEDMCYVGPIDDLESILLVTGTTRLAIADTSIGQSLQFRGYCGIPHVTFASGLCSHPTEKTLISERDGELYFECVVSLNSLGARVAKRFLDIALIVLFSPLIIPFMLLIAIAILVSSPGGVFYSQARIGRGGRVFRAWKFRSMIKNADVVLAEYLQNHPDLREEWEKDHKLKNDPRVTTIGRLLRKTSMDELPQLWNVLLGEMSLVGPRPIVAEEIQKYACVYELYRLVRPGITGLWQVSGRNNTTYEERLTLDRYYIQNWSFMLDIYILYRTIKTALLQEGAY